MIILNISTSYRIETSWLITIKATNSQETEIKQVQTNAASSHGSQNSVTA